MLRSRILQFKSRAFRSNNDASAIPLILFVITIVSCGALYSLFFVEVAYPNLQYLIPASEYKVFLMMLMYAIPLFVIFVGVVALFFVKRGGSLL